MIYLLTTIHVIVCLFLVVVVLLQSGKAADLAGAFGGMGSQTVFGPRGSATVLSKATTIAAALFMVTSLSAVDHGDAERQERSRRSSTRRLQRQQQTERPRRQSGSHGADSGDAVSERASKRRAADDPDAGRYAELRAAGAARSEEVEFPPAEVAELADALA